MAQMQPSPENWVAAVEEFLALQSILQRNFRCWLDDVEVQLTPEEAEKLMQEGPLNRRLVCSASVHVTLPSGDISVQIEPPARAAEHGSADASNGGGKAQAAVAAMRLRHLPPISMQMCIPPGYPQEEPPRCQLFSDWLSPAQISTLHLHLQGLWEHQGPGQPIGFSWIDWLQNDGLLCLGLQDGISLQRQRLPGPDHVAGGHVEADQAGARGVDASVASSSSPAPMTNGQQTHASAAPESGGVNLARPCQQDELGAESGGNGYLDASGSDGAATPGDDGLPYPEAVFGRLIGYDAMREVEIFKEGFHSCGICMEEKHGGQFVWPASCRHAFCQECTQQLCSMHVAEGSLDQLRCPTPDCRAPFSRQEVAPLLSREEVTRWEDLELSQSLQRMPDVVYCPRCSAPCVEDSDNCAQCSQCFFTFCSLCDESWHPGIQCMTAETKLDLLRQRLKGNKDGGADLRRREQEFLSLVEIQKMSKRCPACGIAIEKSEGCNKMTCRNCGTFFCWRCNKRVDGYEHFRTGGGCVLFEVADINEWNVQWEAQVERAQAQARNEFWRIEGGANARMSACPLCGQHNAKVQQNNHMRCWACAGHYCYLCRKPLRGAKGEGGLHFGKGKCRQHSND